eukprot:2254669-Alexandrium_andersonii.AAC.1
MPGCCQFVGIKLAMPARCQHDASTMPARCQFDASAMPARCSRRQRGVRATPACDQHDANAMPARCQRNASGMPARCQRGARLMPAFRHQAGIVRLRASLAPARCQFDAAPRALARLRAHALAGLPGQLHAEGRVAEEGHRRRPALQLGRECLRQWPGVGDADGGHRVFPAWRGGLADRSQRRGGIER